ncbi:acyl-CoA N-acyltransferase [Mycena metata]|uniref:Acyl-CoA N-acyltransferase n=1 Tax=Mycena metata TaxID=1033252 RepID=A0AAD7ND97_9AGAR|nr:acyl-CoA N-acyltransferase [Mycena metata]
MILDGAIASKSGRIALIPPSETDDTATAALRAHPETRRYLRYFPEQVSVDDARTRRLSRATDTTLVDFNIHARNAGKNGVDEVRTFVGTTGIFHVETEYGSWCEVGILISPEYFRGGLATDALYTVLVYVFEERKLHRAEFNTGADNPGMRGWLEKAGATFEGTQRQKWLDPGVGYTDVCKYSILREEWFATVKGRLEAKIERSLSFQSSHGV